MLGGGRERRERERGREGIWGNSRQYQAVVKVGWVGEEVSC